MTALWIVGILLAIFLAVQLSRVGVRLAFGEELRVMLRLGPVHVQVVPKKETAKKKSKKEAAPKKKKEKPKKETPKITARAVLDSLPELWRILKKGLRMTFRRVRISPMNVSAVIGGDDPADTALLYGRLSAAMYAAAPVLQELVRMPDPHIHLEPELQGGKTKISGEVGVSFLIWDLTVIGFACGVPLIKWFLRLRKQPPKAENDTKTQSGKDEQYGKQGKDQPQRNDGDLHEQGAGDGQQ